MRTVHTSLAVEVIITEHVIRDAESEIKRIDREINRLEERKQSVRNDIYRKKQHIRHIGEAIGSIDVYT